MTLCECGCKREVKPGNRFIHGHHTRKPRQEPKLCECGCGGFVTKPENRFIKGHNVRLNHPMNSLISKEKSSKKHKNLSNKIKSEPQLCECGCGEYTKSRNRFIIGHNHRNLMPEDSGNWHGGGIVRICENCGEEYICDKCKSKISRFCSRECYSNYQSEAMIGENNPSWNGGNVVNFCIVCGEEYQCNKLGAITSRFCSRKCMGEWQSENKCGDKNSNWRGGISFDPYCEKFNSTKKREVREKYGNCDYLTGIHRNICNIIGGKIEELSIHHFDYNKMQGCNEIPWKLIPVSRRHNSMFNGNRQFWKRLIEYSLEYDNIYYTDLIW